MFIFTILLYVEFFLYYLHRQVNFVSKWIYIAHSISIKLAESEAVPNLAIKLGSSQILKTEIQHNFLCCVCYIPT